MTKWVLTAALIFLAFPSISAAQSKDAAGDPFAADLYVKHCAQCHDQRAEARVPPRAALEKMSSARLLQVLETGAMREMGAQLTTSERYALAALLGKAESTVTKQLADRCATSSALPTSSMGPAWTGWSAGLNNWRFQQTADAKLSAADVPRLKL